MPLFYFIDPKHPSFKRKPTSSPPPPSLPTAYDEAELRGQEIGNGTARSEETDGQGSRHLRGVLVHQDYSPAGHYRARSQER